MATPYHSLSAIASSIVILFLLVRSNAQDNVPHHGGVISVNMIHRDTPSSPLYNSSLTNWQRVSNALRCSRDRINRFTSSEDESPDHVMYSEGDYLVNISIGTPPRPFIGIVDTGSDLIWTQCMPCRQCFEQNPPLFDPASSSTYRALSCMSNECRLLRPASFCSSNSTSCDYQYSYVDGSNTTGNLSLDTVTLGSTSIPKTIFGCGHQNGGDFSGIESGIVGLGRGAVSFISQIGGYLVGGKYFSYCLVPNPAMSFLSNNSNATSSSKMYFGRPNTSSGPEVVTTPLLSNGVSATQTFYIVELQGISVGANNITLNADAKAFKGNMIIDSGTTLTYLPEFLYDSFKSAIEEELKDRDLEVKQDPTGSGLSCFLTKYDILPGPNVTFHFKGADVKLKSANTFVRVDDETVCLAFSRGSGVGTYGNWAQINYLVGYDLENKTVSFQPTDCTTS